MAVLRGLLGDRDRTDGRPPSQGAARPVPQAGARHRAVVESPDVDPALQGRWTIHSVSRDKGKTFSGGRGIVKARVSARKVEMPGGRILAVEKAQTVRDADGKMMAHVIRFTNGVIWRVQDEDLLAVLVQVFKSKGDRLKERRRFVVTIEQGR